MSRELIQAVYEGDLEKVEALIQAGADCNFENNAGHTPIITATLGKNICMILCLLRNGAEVNRENLEGKTVTNYLFEIPNFTASELKELILVLDQFEAKFDHTDCIGNSFFRSAAAEGHFDIVKYLIEAIELDPIHAFEDAIAGGNPHIVAYFESKINPTSMITSP